MLYGGFWLLDLCCGFGLLEGWYWDTRLLNHRRHLHRKTAKEVELFNLKELRLGREGAVAVISLE